MSVWCLCFFLVYVDLRDLHVLTHSFPTRRSSDLIRTRAVKVDGGYRLSGSKQFITSAQIAGIAIVYAVTDPAAGKRGISGFIVPTDAPGYRVDKVEHKLGQNASDTCAIRFDDVFVEENLRLGAEGDRKSTRLNSSH